MSEFGIPVAADDCINLFFVFTHGTVLGGIGAVAGNILLVENGVYRHVRNFVDRAEDGSDSTDGAAVVQNAFDGAVQSPSGGDGTTENENIFLADHHLHIVTENHLSAAVEFQGGNVNGLVSVHGKNSCMRKLLCQISADDLQTVHTDDGINGDGCLVVGS